MEDLNPMVDVRQPPLSKALHAISVLVGVALLITVFASDPPPLVAAAFLVAAIGICSYNIASVASIATAVAQGPMQVRNRFKTVAMARPDIERVIVRTGLGSLNRVELLLRNGSIVPLVASEMPPLPGARRRVEAQAAEVRAWLERDASR